MYLTVDISCNILFPASDGLTDFHIAAQDGNVEAVKVYMGSPNYKEEPMDREGETPLHKAAKFGRLNVVQFMMPHSNLKEKEPRDKNGESPLHEAVIANNLYIIKYLETQGINPDSVTNEGSTPLHLAARHCLIHMIDHFIVRQYKTRDYKGNTALHEAAGSGCKRGVKKIYNYMYEKEPQNNHKNTPIHIAAWQGKLNIVKYLVGKSSNITATNIEESTPLHLAASHGHLDTVEYLMDNMNNKEPRNKNGDTPLHLSASNGYLEVVAHFINDGLNKEPKNKHSNTPLHAAARSGQIEVVEYLLANDVNVEPRNNNSITPLHYASHNGNKELVELFMDSGFELEPKDDQGNTPLHESAVGGHLEVVKYLMDNSIYKEPKNKAGKRPLHLAAANDNLEVVQYFIESGTVDNEPKDNSGLTPLHEAAIRNNLDVYDFLLTRISDERPKTNNGSTPCDLATENDSSKIMNRCNIYKTKLRGMSYKLRTVRVKIGDDDGDGMDGGLWGVTQFGGGEFKLKICQQFCCETGELESEDDNWEVGEVNYFVGRQLQDCRNFQIDASKDLRLTLKHIGNDGGKINTITLYGSKNIMSSYHECQINQKLDNSESKEVLCDIKTKMYYNESCNGSPEFCPMRFNQVTFAGAHNAGTGMSSITVDCYVKNHDLDMTELLDFGIRFLDFDVKYNENEELYTGHGLSNWYYKFGLVIDAMTEIKEWLAKHPSDIVVLRFGQIDGNRVLGMKKLSAILHNTFSGLNNDIGLNDHFRLTNGGWPTLGEAKAENKRVFAFVKIDGEEDMEHLGDKIIGEIKIKANDHTMPGVSGAVKILSSYDKVNVGYNCLKLVNKLQEACNRAQVTDFTKIDMYSTLAKNIGSCLWTVARKCNSQVMAALNSCQFRNNVRFLQADYPNHPGKNGKTNVEVALEQNHKNKPKI